MEKFDDFDVAGYQRRLQLLREITTGENQQEFADRLGIGGPRWNNYERGYPVPREVAWLLRKKFPGISVEWIWHGEQGNLSAFYRDKIKAAEIAHREHEKAVKALEKAQQRVRATSPKRRRKNHQPSR